MLRTVVLVPLHEEMAYIDGLLTRPGRPGLSVRRTMPVEFEPGADRTDYLLIRASRTTHHITVLVLDTKKRHVMGNISTAATALKTFTALGPQVVFLVGLAGSMASESVRLGDVVVSTSAKFYSPDKVRKINDADEVFVEPGLTVEEMLAGGGGRIVIDARKRILGDEYFRFRRDKVRCEAAQERQVGYKNHLELHPITHLSPINADTLKNLASDQIVNHQPQVHFGTILGSEWVVDSSAYKKFLVDRNTDERLDYYVQKDMKNAKPGVEGEGRRRNSWDPSALLAVDMETYGFLKASQEFSPQLQAFSVRGISDLADRKSELDGATQEVIRKMSVENAATVLIDFLTIMDEWNYGSRRI